MVSEQITALPPISHLSMTRKTKRRGYGNTYHENRLNGGLKEAEVYSVSAYQTEFQFISGQSRSLTEVNLDTGKETVSITSVSDLLWLR